MSNSLTQTVFSVVEKEKGSKITIEGHRRTDSEFFIILEGQAEVQKLEAKTGKYFLSTLAKGDFFGIISAMTGLPELESVSALTPLKLIVIQRKNFGELIQKTPSLALKIARYYSLILRNLDFLQIETLGGEVKDYSDENTMIEIASSYKKLDSKELASYMFQKYLELYPNGVYAQYAKAILSQLPKLDYNNRNTESNIKYYRPGEIIFCEAERGDSLYIILEGEVKIIRNSGHSEITINILTSGQIFGEMALLDNKPRSATAIANTNVKLAIVNKLNFEITTELNPNLMTKIITVLSERVWLLYKKVLNYYIKDTNLKFADALFIFYEQFKSKSSSKTIFKYPFTPEEFLSMIGFNFSKMGELLSFMNSHPFIQIEEGKIFCSDVHALERYVQYKKDKVHLS